MSKLLLSDGFKALTSSTIRSLLIYLSSSVHSVTWLMSFSDGIYKSHLLPCKILTDTGVVLKIGLSPKDQSWHTRAVMMHLGNHCRGSASCSCLSACVAEGSGVHRLGGKPDRWIYLSCISQASPPKEHSKAISQFDLLVSLGRHASCRHRQSCAFWRLISIFRSA